MIFKRTVLKFEAPRATEHCIIRTYPHAFFCYRGRSGSAPAEFFSELGA
jgi:hypothetical protein